MTFFKNTASRKTLSFLIICTVLCGTAVYLYAYTDDSDYFFGTDNIWGSAVVYDVYFTGPTVEADHYAFLGNYSDESVTFSVGFLVAITHLKNNGDLGADITVDRSGLSSSLSPDPNSAPSIPEGDNIFSTTEHTSVSTAGLDPGVEYGMRGYTHISAITRIKNNQGGKSKRQDSWTAQETDTFTAL